MRIAVTGSLGHIGTNVCLEAVKRGHTVIGMDNLVRSLVEENIPVLQKAGVKIVRGDVRNKIDFDKLPQIDAVIHLAGQCGIPYSLISPMYDFEVNALGTLNVLEYSRTHGKIPVVFASSNKAYTDITNDIPVKETETRYEFDLGQPGDPLPLAVTPNGINEDLPLDAFGKYGRSPYGTSKVAADLYCQEYWQAFQVPAVVARMSCIYGYFQKGNQDQAWVSHFLRTLVEGDGKINIFGTGKQVRDMLWGGDVARFYLDAIENIDNVAGQPFNMGGGPGNTMSLIEAITYMEELTGKKAELTFLDKRHGDQDVWITDIRKVKSYLGWEPKVSPKEGINMMLEELKNGH